MSSPSQKNGAPGAPRGNDPGETAQAVALIQGMISQGGEDMAREAPEQLAKLKALLAELKQAAPGAAASARARGIIKDLFAWQLELARADYAERLEELAPSVAAGEPAARATADAYLKVVTLLDRTMAAVKQGGTGSQAEVEKLAAQARDALVAADAELQKAQTPVVRPLGREPVSASGVALKPAAARKPGAATKAPAAPPRPAGFKPPAPAAKITAPAAPRGKPRPAPSKGSGGRGR